MDDGDGNTTIGRIDLYKRGCFVLEAKQGSTVAAADELLFAPERNRRGTAVCGTAGWDVAMKKPKGQAERYVKSLPRERHKLGAHYTPRAYVERLVLPTVIEPSREKWDAARAAAVTLNMQGEDAEARSELKCLRLSLSYPCCTTHVARAGGQAT